jgi:hypothetical protein
MHRSLRLSIGSWLPSLLQFPDHRHLVNSHRVLVVTMDNLNTPSTSAGSIAAEWDGSLAIAIHIAPPNH